MFARTDRLTLRPGWGEDAAMLAEALNDPRIARNTIDIPHPYTLDDAQAWLEAAQVAAGAHLLILAHEGRAVRLIGGIGLSPCGERPCELGCWIVPDCWGRGYATEAAAAMLGIARCLRMRQVTAGCFVDNPASIAVLRKLGFTATGERRAAYCRARGERVTAIDHALLLEATPIRGRSGTSRPAIGSAYQAKQRSAIMADPEYEQDDAAQQGNAQPEEALEEVQEEAAEEREDNRGYQ